MNLSLMIQILRRKKIRWWFNFMIDGVTEICKFLIARCFHGIFYGLVAFELGYCNIFVVVLYAVSFSCIMFSLGLSCASECVKTWYQILLYSFLSTKQIMFLCCNLNLSPKKRICSFSSSILVFFIIKFTIVENVSVIFVHSSTVD